MSVIDATYEQLRELVTSGDLEPGTRLVELSLARRLGVSRPTIREALRSLEARGLARTDGRSLRVVQLSAEELRSALLMRSALEALHAEHAALRVRAGEVAPAELRRLARLARESEEAANSGALADAVRANRAFHQAIDSMAASPMSAQALEGLWDGIIVSTARSLIDPVRIARGNREHRELLAAIEEGRGGRAADVARGHVLRTLEHFTS